MYYNIMSEYKYAIITLIIFIFIIYLINIWYNKWTINKSIILQSTIRIIIYIIIFLIVYMYNFCNVVNACDRRITSGDKEYIHHSYASAFSEGFNFPFRSIKLNIDAEESYKNIGIIIFESFFNLTNLFYPYPIILSLIIIEIILTTTNINNKIYSI